MSTIVKEPSQGGPVQFTADEFWHLIETGFFAGRRVELIGGEIIEMPAQSNHHLATIRRIERLLESVFGTGFWVRAQGSLNLAPHGVPDPDIAVVPGDPESPADDLPQKAVLVVEVSDSRLTYDRTKKASLYASRNVQDYWIVNIPDRQLEIRRDPQPDSTQEFGYGYASLSTLRPGSTATPLAVPSAAIPVERLFLQ